jgi:hypothetical protein
MEILTEHINNVLQHLPDNITLVAVTKTRPVEILKQAYEFGLRDFGENRVQEMIVKQAELPSDIRWHLIGHLQTNKVKFIAPFVHLVHSVESLKLLEEINKQAKKNNRVIDCLLQVYIATEESNLVLMKLRFDRYLNLTNTKALKISEFAD